MKAYTGCWCELHAS